MLSFTNISSDIKLVAKADQLCQINIFFSSLSHLLSLEDIPIEMRQKPHTKNETKKTIVLTSCTPFFIEGYTH